ncbi:hypothetical protein TPDSL_40780 (plasmid) [Terrisporobacter petrolearius]|uniref:hypothetical protein n=1 Tax=Terrisporobacter petrolearius TaxID=1460447 RepID=UPI003367AEFA
MNTSLLLEKKYKLKQFLMATYKPIIQEGNNLKDNEYITLVRKINGNFVDDTYKNIDDFIESIFRPENHYHDVYFNVSSTNGIGRTTEAQMTRTCLAFDFDRKDLGDNCNLGYIQEQFKRNGLYYHAIIDSGNGYHFYIFIEPTTDILKVAEVTKILINRLGADDKAGLTTQILRVPGTFNNKDPKDKKKVNRVYLDENIKRKNINYFVKKYQQCKPLEGGYKSYVINNTNIPPCVLKIILSGSEYHNRNIDLQKIVVSLRQFGKTEAQVLDAAKQWNSNNEKDYTELKYQVNHMYNNLRTAELDCKNCNENCWSRVESNFLYSDNEILMTLSESHTKYLKSSTRKGAKKMNGNDLLIYGVLKNHNDGLYREEIEEVITYKNKREKIETVALSKNTLTNTLKSLEENKFITVETRGKRKFYKLNNLRTKEELTYNISMAATYDTIRGLISTEELRLYNYMRYLHNKEQRENPKALKGNLFQVNQDVLAKDLGITQGRISIMVNNLLDAKVMDIWYRKPSGNNGFLYNIYRLNY